MPFSSFPTEVVELVLICAAAAGFPEAIAAFSQTCRAHKELVFASDNHLWREIFLATFDDPRETSGGPGWQQASARRRDTEATATPFDWGQEFRRRIWAARYIRRQVSLRWASVDGYDSDTRPQEIVQLNVRALDALLSAVATALPCPPLIVYSFLVPENNSAHIEGSMYPDFPPLPLSETRPHQHGSLNIRWLTSVLEQGYPPSITVSLSGNKWPGGLLNQFLDADEFQEMQSAGRLIACTGFMPVPNTPPRTLTQGEDSVPDPHATEEQQRKRARRLARMRVYNMRYLARERHWGPFLPCGEKKARPSRAPVGDDELLQPILALFGQPVHMHADEDEDDDGGWVEAEGHQHAQEHAHNHHEDEDDEDEDGDGDDDDEEEDGDDAGADEGGEEDEDNEPAEPLEAPPAPAGAGGAGPASLAPPSPPSPAQLRADWAYLGAVRTVVEANLRGTFENEQLRGLFSLDGLRAGSAPWNTSQYGPNREDGAPAADNDKGKEKEKGESGEEVQGWDWAGVTGVWKRCICWMDYRDLILHNLSGEFDDEHLGEAVRVIPMRMRIESYSPCEVPGYEHLPTIHVIGETVGASVTGLPRRLHGTVGVIADGSVRWSLFSSVEGGGADEWVSEGVQIGGIASAMGVLGMWTGAQHERMDPLGPSWAWKVG